LADFFSLLAGHCKPSEIKVALPPIFWPEKISSDQQKTGLENCGSSILSKLYLQKSIWNILALNQQELAFQTNPLMTVS
jgi:hypothetical protein